MRTGEKLLLTAILALAAMAASADAAGAQTFWKRAGDLWRRLSGPSPHLDSVYIYQPFKGWGAGVAYGLASEQVQVITDSHYTSLDVGSQLISTIDLQLGGEPVHSIGVLGRYGPIQLGYNREIGLSKGFHKNFSFRWLGNFFCLDVRHTRYMSELRGNLSLELAGFEDPNLNGQTASLDISKGSFANMTTTIVNGIYAFNRKRFAYRAAYNGRVVQRRSAGSFLVAGKFQHGDLVIDTSDILVSSLINGMGSYSTSQFSLGAGYSFNWVLFHRDAASQHDLRGLRNLNFNVTAVPMLTLFNRIQTRQRPFASKYYEDYGGEEHTYRMVSSFHPNFTARAGFCYNTGHFYLILWGDYNRFYFRSKPTEFRASYGSMVITQRGEFSTWTVNLQLNYRF